MPSPLAPPFVLGALAALLYARGRARHLRVVAPHHRAGLAWRAVAFWAALVTLVLALDSVVDDKADRYFWVHMVQHVLLMMVVAPLLVLSAPWLPMWKGLPLSTRRGLGAAYMRSPGWRAARAVGRRLALPVVVWILFSADLVAWHVPALYGLTLRSQAVHDLEHFSFLMLSVLFWAQVIESPPLRPRLDQARRVVYVVGGATVCWLLAIVLTFASSPLYAGYEAAASQRGGLSALADQQLAAGIMVGPGSIPYAVFVFLALYRWLDGSIAKPSLESDKRQRVADPPARAGGGPLAHRS
ncbi:MAG TPA: cytochrome c oxidase assembly protein [Thermoleophilaceae bacterium]|nr:cytochrome c oxidase assembly protein [Thermoleophilaceae bacterium]